MDRYVLENLRRPYLSEVILAGMVFLQQGILWNIETRKSLFGSALTTDPSDCSPDGFADFAVDIPDF